MPDTFYMIFVFMIGACVGSFLNVVVYRLPLGISLVFPGSYCPQCKTPLAWYDNIPVLGWIFLGGKCRYCKKPISPRYPVVEAITGLLFVFYYVMFFRLHAGPCDDLAALGADPHLFAGTLRGITQDWPIYALYMVLISGLLAASIIDAELFIIPAGIPWLIAAIAMLVHGIIDHPGLPGSLLLETAGLAPAALSLSAGALAGLGISNLLLWRKILPLSFPQDNLLEAERQELQKQGVEDIPPEYTPKQVRAEMRKEMLFLMPPLALAGLSLALCRWAAPVAALWTALARVQWANAMLASALGAMIGAFTVWITRILGSYGFGKEAMGLGDVHLMLAVGAVLGGGAAVLAFFIAPFFAIVLSLYMFIAHRRRQLPYGPYLSMAAAAVMLFYCPMAAYFRPGLLGLMDMLGGRVFGV